MKNDANDVYMDFFRSFHVSLSPPTLPSTSSPFSFYITTASPPSKYKLRISSFLGALSYMSKRYFGCLNQSLTFFLVSILVSIVWLIFLYPIIFPYKLRLVFLILLVKSFFHLAQLLSTKFRLLSRLQWHSKTIKKKKVVAATWY